MKAIICMSISTSTPVPIGKRVRIIGWTNGWFIHTWMPVYRHIYIYTYICIYAFYI